MSLEMQGCLSTCSPHCSDQPLRAGYKYYSTCVVQNEPFLVYAVENCLLSISALEESPRMCIQSSVHDIRILLRHICRITDPYHTPFKCVSVELSQPNEPGHGTVVGRVKRLPFLWC